MQGILLLDKPAGWTSHDVVNYVRKIVAQHEGKKPKNTKVGHTGTLDPFATGLLVLLIGKEYTRKAATLAKLDKTYEVTMKLGEVSSTGDPEGEITELNDARPSNEELEAVLQKFTGQIEQVPPAYSAIKVNGQRAYKLARAGKEVTIEPRTITVHSLELKTYAYPEVQLVTSVSSGTYIRALVEDIAKALGTGAYTKELRRTVVGKFSIEDASPVQNLTAEQIEKALQP
jgi:tRNA pseudouridine55 synthase